MRINRDVYRTYIIHYYARGLGLLCLCSSCMHTFLPTLRSDLIPTSTYTAPTQNDLTFDIGDETKSRSSLEAL